MKNGDQTSNLIVGLLLEFKVIINSKDDKYLLVDKLLKIVDNYKKIFTTMKDNNIINLTELPKNHLQNLTKERYLHMNKKQDIL